MTWKSSHTHPFLLVILFMVWYGVLVLQRPTFASSRGLGSFHVITHCCAVSDGRGWTVAWKSLDWALILVTALVDVALVLASLHRGLLLVLGNVSGLRCMQCQ